MRRLATNSPTRIRSYLDGMHNLTGKQQRCVKFYAIAILMFTIPVTWYSLVVPMFSIYMFPNGINVSFAKGDKLKPIRVLGDQNTRACLGKLGATEDVIANVVTLSDGDTAAVFISQEAARRLHFMNLSESLWAISIVGTFVGVASCAVGRRGIASEGNATAKYIVVSAMVLGPLVIALALTDFGNDVNDLFQFDFIGRNLNQSRPIGWVESFTGDPTANTEAVKIGYGFLGGVWGRVQTFIALNVLAAFGSASLVSWGLACIFANLASKPPSADYLRSVRAVIRYSLYACAAVFTLGVLTESSLHGWALIFAKPYDSCLQSITGELRTFIGINYAIALGFIFLPVFVIWLFRTHQLANLETKDKTSTSQEWQKAAGLDVTAMEFIRSFVIIVLPTIVPSAVSFFAKIPI
jgi:hypothetical protein